MYKEIVFDIDGTLINTENAVLNSLKDTLTEVLNKTFDVSELTFALGITGVKALEKLNVEDIPSAIDLWNINMNKYRNYISIFDEIEIVLNELKYKYNLGIVTSKTREEFDLDFSCFGLNDYFKTVICADDTTNHKPNPEPLLKYMKIANVSNNEIIYIGDSIYDMYCAKSSLVDFAFAKWGNKTQTLDAKYVLNSPLDILQYLCL